MTAQSILKAHLKVSNCFDLTMRKSLSLYKIKVNKHWESLKILVF